MSDSFVHMSSLSHRQLGWKSAYGLAAYGLFVFSNWSVPLSMQELSATVKNQMLTHVDEKLVGCQRGCGPDMCKSSRNSRSLNKRRVKSATWLFLPVVIYFRLSVLVRNSTCLPGSSRCLAGGKTTEL